MIILKKCIIFLSDLTNLSDLLIIKNLNATGQAPPHSPQKIKWNYVTLLEALPTSNLRRIGLTLHDVTMSPRLVIPRSLQTVPFSAMYYCNSWGIMETVRQGVCIVLTPMWHGFCKNKTKKNCRNEHNFFFQNSWSNSMKVTKINSGILTKKWGLILIKWPTVLTITPQKHLWFSVSSK